MKTKPYTMTVAEFKSRFYRHKDRGDHIHQIEFHQVYTVTIDPEVDG